MLEAKISELVEIQNGYTSYVALEQELFDDNKNVGRMSRYRPITSHRRAFGQMARALNIKDGRCYLLTGSYGTGKSHLCLMFANYLKTPAHEPPMPEFLDHYAAVEPHEANSLRDKRQKGRFLVALCAWGGKEDFDEVVLRATDIALKREGFGEDFDTNYLQAVRKIEYWQGVAQSGNAHFLDAFERELEETNPGQTVNAFKKRLSEFDLAALQEFKRIHQSITTSPFTHDKADLNEILIATLSSERFKQKFAGILVLFDEFGYTMEQGNLSPKAFQRFAQLCGEPPVECAPLIFVGTAHKALTQYAKGYSSENFHTASDRIKEIALTADGVEEIIGAIVVPQKASALWQEQVASRADTFDGFVKDCQRLQLFEWLPAPKLRRAVIENIYPMHPMATYALLRLAQDVASNNRSVFTFFSGEAGGGTIPGSYGDFVAHERVLVGYKLNLFTADRLFEYFGATLQSDNKELRDIVRDHIKDFENSLRALNEVKASDPMADAQYSDNPLVRRLMRLLLIHEIIGVPNRADNIQFGLYCVSEAEKNQLKNLVDDLIARNVLYKIKETGVLEFKKSTAFDIDRRIEDYKHDAKNQPQNLVAELNELAPLHPKNDLYLEAKDYNLAYSEDKRLERRLVRVADLETEKMVNGAKNSYFEWLEAEIEAEIARKGEYEGLVLYVVCDKTEDITRAKNLCAKNSSNRVVVAIPKQPVPLLELILELRALLAIEKSEEKKSFTVQDNAAFMARLAGDSNRPGARQALVQARERLMNHKEVTWHGKSAAALPVDEHKTYDAANRVMETLYSDGRNRLAHDDLNKLHLKVDKGKSVALKEAVEKLADYTQPLIIDTDFPQQRGDRRYLEKCLLQQGALVQGKAVGSKLPCSFESNTEKYKSKLPALAAMMQEVEALGGGKIQLSAWAQRYRKPCYGQGPVALALFLACLRRRFGDSIRFKMDESAVGDMPMRTYEEILSLSDGQYANAFVSYKPLTSAEKQLANRVYKLFGSGGSAENRDCTLVEAHNALKQWSAGLPPLSKVVKLYDADKHPRTAGFLDALSRLEAKDAHAFLFEELPVAFGHDAGNAITEGTVTAIEAELEQEKTTIESALSDVEQRLFEAVRALFGVQGSTYSDILDAITAWYNGLDAQQRDVHARYHDNDSKPLVVHLKQATDWRETFLTTIPNSPDYALRAVRDWGQDKVEEYCGRLQSGKARIEANRIRVEAPKLQPTGAFDWPEGGALSFEDEIEIAVTTELAGAKIFVAEGNNDPTNASSQREQIGDKPLKVRENKQLRIAAQDPEGNWSPIQTVNLINANKPFEPSISGNVLGEKTATFKFPVNKDSLKVTCRELFKKSLELGVVAPEELQECVEAALQEARKN